MKNAGKIILFLFLLIFASCSNPAYMPGKVQAEYNNPVSVMEDHNVDKTGIIAISVEDIEKARSTIYEIARNYDGYIYYENYRTVNADQHAATIKLALHNNVFLDCFNNLRSIGIIVTSEIKASLEESVQNYTPTIMDSINSSSRKSSLEIQISQSASLGNYTKVVLRNAQNVLNVLLPSFLVLVLFIAGIVIIYFSIYIAYYGLIRKVFKRIVSKYNRDEEDIFKSDKVKKIERKES